MNNIRRRIFEIISVGNRKDIPSTVFDIALVVAILLNLFATFMGTYSELQNFSRTFYVIEAVTSVLFLIEYLLRIMTADFLYPKEKNKIKAVFKFMISLSGLIDLFTLFPFIMPFLFPSGMVAFRLFRVFRIFRLFRLTSQYDAFQVIVNVLNEKKRQLVSSVVILLIFMVASSLVMYDLEHVAQPDQFQNAFSGIWWAVSAFLTVGYGDIYPVTLMGKVMGIVIAFTGVGLVAIPTGIISAGFVEYFSRIHYAETVQEERRIHFITSQLYEKHQWVGKTLDKIILPTGIRIAAIVRNGQTIKAAKEEALRANDVLILAERSFTKEEIYSLRELVVKEENKWLGKQIRDLDISRLEMIVSIKRNGKFIHVTGSTVIRKDDVIAIFYEEKESDL